MTGGEYSLLRALTGVLLVLALVHAPPLLMAAGLALTVAFVVGFFHRTAAAALAAVLLAASPALPTPGRLLAVLVLAVHAALPPKPYGTLAMRGDVDPGATWRFPQGLLVPLWCGLVLSALQATAIYAVALGLLALMARIRSIPWIALLLLAVVSMIRSGPGDVPGEWMALMLTFQPDWLKPLPKAGGSDELIFYDGTCGLCHGFVRFVLSEDDAGAFRFAPLQSDTFAARVPEDVRKTLPDSIVVATADGQVLTRSAAVKYVLLRLGGIWSLFGRIARVLPQGVLDIVYDSIARVRHRFFKRPTEACPLMPKELRARFLY